MNTEAITLECLVCGTDSNCLKKRLFTAVVTTELNNCFKLLTGLDELYQTDYLCATCLKNLRLVAKFHDTCLHSKAILLRKQPIPFLDGINIIEKKFHKTDSSQSNKIDQTDDISPFKWPSTSSKGSNSNKADDRQIFFSTIRDESTDVASIDSDWFHEMKERVKRRKYYCEECDIGINSNVQWIKHLKKMHNAIEKKFICDVCGKDWSDRQNLIEHFRTHSSQDPIKKPYQCNYCNTSFARQHTLKKHIRSHLNLRSFKCEHCNKGFNFDSSLRDHIQRVHLQMYKFFCEICPSKFYDKQGLNYHLKVHSGSKNCQCPYCSEVFYSNSDRNSHCRKKHADKPVPKSERT